MVMNTAIRDFQISFSSFSECGFPRRDLSEAGKFGHPGLFRDGFLAFWIILKCKLSFGYC